MSEGGKDWRKLRWLLLDLNSFFASVEQQLNPELRGRPTIVVPLMSDYTVAIAASYEAKALGIKTGTGVRDAKARCSDLAILPARHDVYVDFHHRIVDEIENHLHVTKIMSIDEVACELLGSEREPDKARQLALEIKRGIESRVGECLKSSIGIAPSRLLAKIASNLQKPDGLTIIQASDLPGPLLNLPLIALPGIGANMERRLKNAGLKTAGELYHLPPGRARTIWHSIEGERLWYGLHGIDPPAMEEQRRSVSHSQVLGPRLRSAPMARLVTRRLLTKAASRLRRMGYKAAALALSLRLEDGSRIVAEQRMAQTYDSFVLLQILEKLWARAGREIGHRRIKKTGIALGGLAAVAEVQPDLFGWTPMDAEDTKSVRLSFALDRLNARYGRDTVSIGVQPGPLPSYTGAKIAFNRIPDREEFTE